jgi:hypothetical protein
MLLLVVMALLTPGVLVLQEDLVDREVVDQEQVPDHPQVELVLQVKEITAADKIIQTVRELEAEELELLHQTQQANQVTAVLE